MGLKSGGLWGHASIFTFFGGHSGGILGLCLGCLDEMSDLLQTSANTSLMDICSGSGSALNNQTGLNRCFLVAALSSSSSDVKPELRPGKG